MSFNPREPKEYETVSDETLIALGVGHGGDFSGSVIVEATRRLRRSIDEFNTSSTRQANIMIRLGWATVGLSIVMLIFTGVQVWLALRY